jgi:hypothetical protein
VRKKDFLCFGKKEINGNPNRISWIVGCPVMLWFIGQKDCNWYWLFKADTSLLHLISYCIGYECTSFVIL